MEYISYYKNQNKNELKSPNTNFDKNRIFNEEYYMEPFYNRPSQKLPEQIGQNIMNRTYMVNINSFRTYYQISNKIHIRNSNNNIENTSNLDIYVKNKSIPYPIDPYTIRASNSNFNLIDTNSTNPNIIHPNDTVYNEKIHSQNINFQNTANSDIDKQNVIKSINSNQTEKIQKLKINDEVSEDMNKNIIKKQDKIKKENIDPEISDINILIQNEEFNVINLEEFMIKFKNDKNYKKLYKIKTIQESLLTPIFHITKIQLDSRGNRYEDWPRNQTRGGETYDVPVGWIGIGLKVLGKYSEDCWLDMYDQEGEWVIAYHGVGSGLKSDEVKYITSSIINKGFKIGKRHPHKDCPDAFHKGEKVGEGVYCTPFINVAEAYAGVSIINECKYKTVIMARVKPWARRHCNLCEESKKYQYWAVNEDEIRPYRILYKKC